MKFAPMLFTAAFVLVIAGCNSNDKSNKENGDKQVTEEVADTVYESSAEPGGDSTLYVKNQSLLWHVVDSNGLKLKKPVKTGIDTMSVLNVVDLLNNNYDSIHLDYLKTSHDTVYIHIPRSEMLTERLGSTGAQMFLASATYSLTELKGIHFVNFDFIEGDHATPGVYDRSYFTNIH